MVTRFLPYLGVALIAFLVGRHAFPARDGSAADTDTLDCQEANPQQDFSGRERRISKRGGQRKNTSDLGPGESAELLFYGLTTADPIEGDLLVYEQIAAMNESNWSEIMEQFRRSTRETGKTEEHLWSRALMRVGQVAGRQALDDFLAKGIERYHSQTQNILYGWAMKNPDEAASWLDSVENLSGDQELQLKNALAGGVALSRPEALADTLRHFDEREQLQVISNSVDNLIRGGGLARAGDWLVNLETDEWSDELKQVSFEHVSRAALRAINNGQALDVTMKFFQDHRESPFLPESQIVAAAKKIAYHEPEQALGFLNDFADTPQLRGSVRLSLRTQEVVSVLSRRDPAALEQWLQRNEGAALYEQVLQARQNLTQPQLGSNHPDRRN